MSNQYTLSHLGWNNFFQQQLSLGEYEFTTPARVVGQERSLLHLFNENGKVNLPITPSMPEITVGDWLLLEGGDKFHRLLERSSLFSPKAAGTKISRQLIAANIDTVFVVSSMNQDFNLNRFERYLALTNESDVETVIVLTKIDYCDDPEAYIAKAQSLSSSLHVLAVNSLDHESAEQLLPWCQPTRRSIHLLPSGALLLDTPGMRELQLAECEHGIDETFAEITAFTQQCKFSDCQHQGEPGCAVRAAIGSGELDVRRLESYLKLMKEQAFNQATLAERRAQDREFGRYIKSVLKSKREK